MPKCQPDPTVSGEDVAVRISGFVGIWVDFCLGILRDGWVSGILWVFFLGFDYNFWGIFGSIRAQWPPGINKFNSKRKKIREKKKIGMNKYDFKKNKFEIHSDSRFASRFTLISC